jgi:hypothetical protein
LCRFRRPFAPDGFDQAIPRDDFVRVQEQNGKESPLPRAADCERLTVLLDL